MRYGLVVVLIGTLALIPMAFEASATPKDPPGGTVVQPDVKALIKEARRALRKAQWAEAKQLALKARAADPNAMEAEEILEAVRQQLTAAALLKKAEASEAAGRLEAAWLAASDGLAEGRTTSWKALRVLERRVRRILARAAIELANAHMKAKRFRKAESAYSKALQYDPNNRRAQAGLVRAGRAGR